jgi:hypothetical protein
MASGGMIYVSNFMMIDSGVQGILRLLPPQLRDCSVDTEDEKDL